VVPIQKVQKKPTPGGYDTPIIIPEYKESIILEKGLLKIINN
jgi:hypothetical protein